MNEVEYAEPLGYVKSFDDTKEQIVVVGIPFTSPLPGNLDRHNQYFDKNTDIGVLDEVMVYFNHNKYYAADKSPAEIAKAERLAKAFRGKILGKARKAETTEEGVLYNIVLDKRIPYIQAIEDMIQDGLLDISSGAKYGELDAEKEGRISKWHAVELSFTPNPANPNAVVLSKSILEKAIEELDEMPDENATPVAQENVGDSGSGEATPNPTDALMKSLEAVLAKQVENVNPAGDALLEKSAVMQTELSELRNQVVVLTELVKSLHTALPYMAEQIVMRIDGVKSASTFERQVQTTTTPKAPPVGGKSIFGSNGPKLPNLKAIGE